MKNYKYPIALALVLLMALGIYFTVSDARSQRNDYNKYLKEARKLSNLDVVEDAAENYSKALELRDSADVRVEVGEMYVAQDWLTDAIKWGEETIGSFPKSPEAYAFLLKCYIAAEEYDECFALRDEANARKAIDKEFISLMQKVEYQFELGFEHFDDVSVFSGGYCAVKKEELWGYVNNQGEIDIKEKFAWAGPFSSDGIAAVKDQNGDYCYVGFSGNKKIAVQNLKTCTGLGMSIEQILPAADDGKFHYYDTDFNLKIKDDYTYATPMNGNSAAVNKEGRWFLIDSSGKRLTNDDYDEIILDEKGIAYRNERAFVHMDGQVYMISSSGKKVNKTPYEDAILFFQSASLAAVKSDGLWGFVDKDGKEVIKPEYEEARSFSNGYAAVKIDGKWGFIDEAGKLVIENQFQDAKDFNEDGCVFVRISDNWQLLKLLRNNYE